jgi:hypothetical protein
MIRPSLLHRKERLQSYETQTECVCAIYRIFILNKFLRIDATELYNVQLSFSTTFVTV